MTIVLFVQAWRFVLNESTTMDVLHSVPEIKEDWFAVIRSVMESRVSEIPKDKIVNVLCDIELHKDTPDVLMNVFMDQASKSLDHLFQKDHVSIHAVFEA